MSRHSELALVLDISSYRETSSLIRMFTENEGRITLVARGLRSAKDTHGAAALQPFNLVHVHFSLKEGASIGNLISVEIAQAAEAPHTSIEAYALVSFWFEILKETSQERAALRDIFGLTRQMLTSQLASPGLTFHYLQQLSALMAALGFALTWNQCTVCGRHLPPGDTSLPRWFSITRGGIVCQSCADAEVALPLSADEGLMIRQLVDAPGWDVLTAPGSTPEFSKIKEAGAKLLPLLNIVHRYMTHHLEHPLKTIKFLNETIG